MAAYVEAHGSAAQSRRAALYLTHNVHNGAALLCLFIRVTEGK